MDPQPVDDNNTNISGISDGLQEFLTNWANDDIDPADVAKMLHSPEGAQYQGWLSQELSAAYASGILTPTFLEMACNRHFDDQQGVAVWLQSVWPVWFDQPMPGVTPAPSTGQTPPPVTDQAQTNSQ